MGFFDIYPIFAGFVLPVVFIFAWVAFQEYRESKYLLSVYAPDVYAEYSKPKHLRGPYPPLKK